MDATPSTRPSPASRTPRVTEGVPTNARRNAAAAAATASPADARRSWSLAALLAALAMAGPFSIDMYLPAFDSIRGEFDASTVAVQQTLSAYLFAYAFMMLWHGALSDALGRRVVVIASLAVFAFASLGCAIAGNLQSLWLFRTLQGLSAGAGLVVGRAVIRDRFEGPEAQRLMSQITLVFGTAPALAPVIGGALLNLFGWRAIFWTMAGFSIGVLAWAFRGLPETLPAAMRQPLHPGALWRNYRAVLWRMDFVLLALVPTLNFAAFFVYIASAPSFLAQLGVSTWGFAWLFVPMITGVMLGATASGHLAGTFAPHRTIALGYAAMFTGTALNALVVAFVAPGVPWHVLPILVFTFGSSLVMPSLTLLLLDLFPMMRGLTSSLQGFVQFAFSGIVAGTIAPFLAQSLVGLMLGMAAFAAVSFAIWRLYVHRTSARSLL
jgi:DHA1 family bicyclomycin/chloramphenicol resistance-like MFS transporter